MSTELLKIQPQEIRFIFESKKQCSCSVRLVNETNQHVAFKVTTTSPKKYCVRPNTGLLNPKAVCDFTVTMQAQPDIPPDMICKDKFLLQCAMVVAETTEEDIVFQKKEALKSTSEADDGDNAKLTKFDSVILIIDSAKREEIHIDSDLIEGKSSVLKTIIDCGRESGQQLILKIDREEEIPLKSLLYFLHQHKLKEELARNPCDIFGLLLVADKYCAISCIKKCSQLLRGLDMIEEVALMYLDPWSILMMTDVDHYGMIKSAKEFFMNKYKDFERFPDDLKSKLTLLESFLVDKFCEIQSAPEKIGLSLLEAVLESNTIQVDSEDEIYDLLITWSKVHYPHEQQRIKFLSERIHLLVRFVFMSRHKLFEAKGYWKAYPIISNKIGEGFVYHSLSSFGTRTRFLDYRKNKLDENEAVLEAAARKPYEQECLEFLQVKEDEVEFFEERAYRRRPIRISLKNEPHFASCCVYMELKREHFSKILANGKCDSQVFYPFKGVQGFVLSARCIDQADGISTFGFFLERYEEGPERIEFDCKFHIFSKNDDVNSDYTFMYETRYTGQPIACTDLLPWLDLMDDNSPFFLGGVLYTRVDMFQI